MNSEFLILRTNLNNLIRNVNKWNELRNLGLDPLGQSEIRAAWEAGNCLILARSIDDSATEIWLHLYRRLPADDPALVAWNSLGRLFAESGWLISFEPLRVHIIQHMGIRIADELADSPIPDEERWKAEYRGALKASQVHLSEEEINVRIHEGWQDFVSFATSLREERDRRREAEGRSAAEAAEMFIAAPDSPPEALLEQTSMKERIWAGEKIAGLDYFPKTAECLNKWKRAWEVMAELDEVYEEAYLEESTKQPLPSWSDYREALGMAHIWLLIPSEKTVRRVRKAGKLGMLE